MNRVISESTDSNFFLFLCLFKHSKRCERFEKNVV